VNARRWDIYKEAFENDDHFSEYLDATAGGLMLAAAQLLGTTQKGQAIRDYGAAAGLANWLIAVPDLEVRGRIPLVDGRPEAVTALASTTLSKLRTAKRLLPKIAYPATRTGWQADRTLRSAAATPAAVIGGRLHNSEFLKKSLLIWTVLSRSP
jgi:phytoene synthase